MGALSQAERITVELLAEEYADAMSAVDESGPAAQLTDRLTRSTNALALLPYGYRIEREREPARGVATYVAYDERGRYVCSCRRARIVSRGSCVSWRGGDCSAPEDGLAAAVALMLVSLDAEGRG